MLFARELRRRRFAAQGLHASQPRSVDDAVRAALAVQAHDLRAARLALRARVRDLTIADVDAALTAERSLVVCWLMRGTLHLVHRDDYPWLWALTARTSISANQRRLGQEGVAADAERALSIIEQALSSEGPLTRIELAAHIERANIPSAGQAMPHLLMFAALRGVIVLGPVCDGKQAFVLTEDWLGRRPAPLADEARPAAFAELAQRYLHGHGPATAADVAAWSGLALRDVRAGLRRIAGDLREDGDLLDIAERDPAPSVLPARLLPAFDPYLLGWRDRGFAVPAEYSKRVYPGGGMLRATALADGLAVATWTLQQRAGRPAVELDPFAELAPAIHAALRAEADEVARFQAGRPVSD